MEEQRSAALLEHFRELADPRIDRHKEHKLYRCAGHCDLRHPVWGQ
jgi:hypothetical protein